MRSFLSAAALAGLLAFSAACDKAATAANGPLTGTWRYQAVGLVLHPQHPGTEVCDLDLVLDVTQNDNVLTGQSRLADGRMVCRVPGQPDFTHPLQETGVAVVGEVQDGRLAFSLSGAFHSFGEVHPDRIQGVVERYGGVLGDPTIQVDTMGAFVLERVR